MIFNFRMYAGKPEKVRISPFLVALLWPCVAFRFTLGFNLDTLFGSGGQKGRGAKEMNIICQETNNKCSFGQQTGN